MRRIGSVIRIKPERIEEYKEYHRNVWPEVLKAHGEAGQRRFAIFLKGDLLFSYSEYVWPDDEYAERMRNLIEKPRMREWLAIMQDIQAPLETRKPGEWWAEMEEVFHAE